MKLLIMQSTIKNRYHDIVHMLNLMVLTILKTVNLHSEPPNNHHSRFFKYVGQRSYYGEGRDVHI